jgi:heme/copper-type cytochrome/quinol oxidase subunit 2
MCNCTVIVVVVVVVVVIIINLNFVWQKRKHSTQLPTRPHDIP